MLESVVPTPALPAKSATPVLSSVITLVVSAMLLAAVNVPVQVIPPSPLLTALSVPLATVRSALLKPATASEKVMVTSEVAPEFKLVLATTMVAVGGVTSGT
ncbi:hypothetical protein D3C71_1766350 [compost metagenome]